MSGAVSLPPPTLAGFTAFAYGSMGIPVTALPVGSQSLVWAYDIALALVPQMALSLCLPGIYTIMVYNLAADNLVNFSSDVAGSTYFADLRSSLGLDKFTSGLVQSTGDNGTSVSLMIPDALKTLTLADLRYLKTPWGRAYLALAQSLGTVWGLN